jgi:hypothetical protein
MGSSEAREWHPAFPVADPGLAESFARIGRAAIDRAGRSAPVRLSDPRRVLLAGDVHGNAHWVDRLCKIANTLECPALLQLGDFGFWSHTSAGEQYLDHVNRTATAKDLVILWIPGNHENHDLLAAFPVDADGLITLRERIRCVPSGTRWTWNGIRFGALGGAYSVDRYYRKEGIDLWQDLERPTRADLQRLGSDPLDVLVCHDAPEGAVDTEQLGLKWLRPELIEASLQVRVLLAEAVTTLRPKLVLHGHWHARNRSRLILDDGTVVQVEGFASDLQANEDSWGVLEIPGLEVVRGDEAAL